MPLYPPNRYVYSDDERVDRAGWEIAVKGALSREGVSPDFVCLCSLQGCGDREEVFEYRDAAIGVFRSARLLRLVSGFNHTPEAMFDLRTQDIDFSSIRRIILRRRSRPAWSSPVRDRDGLYQPYDFYYQTRIYTATEAHYAPRNEESRIRLIDARYICEWLSEHTGIRVFEDSQQQPLDGYPEGV